MKKKKLVSIALVLALAATALAACGGSSSSSSATEAATAAATEAATEAAAEAAEEAEDQSEEAAEASEGDTHEVVFPDGYPKKEIQLIVPFAAGGAFDSMARTLQVVIKDMYDVDVYVDCVEGGGSAVGVTQTLTSAPDGYTIGFGSTSYLGLIAQGTMDWDPENADFLCVISKDPLVLIAKADGDYNTLDKYLDAALANPGTITLGNPGSNNTNQADSKFLDMAVGEGTFQLLPFSDGDSRVVTEVLGGHLDAGVLKPNSCMSQLLSGELTIIGSFTQERLEAFPDVPTFAEYGYDVFPYGDVAQTVCFALAPKGLDPEIKNCLAEMLYNATQSQQFQELAEAGGFEADGLHGVGLDDYILTDLYGGAEVLAEKVFDN